MDLADVCAYILIEAWRERINFQTALTEVVPEDLETQAIRGYENFSNRERYFYHAMANRLYLLFYQNDLQLYYISD